MCVFGGSHDLLSRRHPPTKRTMERTGCPLPSPRRTVPARGAVGARPRDDHRRARDAEVRVDANSPGDQQLVAEILPIRAAIRTAVAERPSMSLPTICISCGMTFAPDWPRSSANPNQCLACACGISPMPSEFNVHRLGRWMDNVQFSQSSARTDASKDERPRAAGIYFPDVGAQRNGDEADGLTGAGSSVEAPAGPMGQRPAGNSTLPDGCQATGPAQLVSPKRVGPGNFTDGEQPHGRGQL